MHSCKIILMIKQELFISKDHSQGVLVFFLVRLVIKERRLSWPFFLIKALILSAFQLVVSWNNQELSFNISPLLHELGSLASDDWVY